MSNSDIFSKTYIHKTKVNKARIWRHAVAAVRLDYPDDGIFLFQQEDLNTICIAIPPERVEIILTIGAMIGLIAYNSYPELELEEVLDLLPKKQIFDYTNTLLY